MSLNPRHCKQCGKSFRPKTEQDWWCARCIELFLQLYKEGNEKELNNLLDTPCPQPNELKLGTSMDLEWIVATPEFRKSPNEKHLRKGRPGTFNEEDADSSAYERTETLKKED